MTAEAASADGIPARQRPGRLRRIALMASLPLALAAAGGYAYVTGGRYVSTDNAYLQQDKVSVGPDVSGRIVEVDVRENEAVAAGQVLFRLDPEPFRLAVRRAEAEIASARLKVEQLRAAHRQSLADQQAAEQALAFRQREFDRQERLAQGGYAAQAKFDEVRNDLQAAQQRLAAARQEVLSAQAALAGDPGIETDRHPSVLEALARRDQAALDLEHATVRAAAAGVVSQTDRLHVGQFVPAGTPVLSLVETGEAWVEANFKETDLTHMAVGQTATIELDAYPGREIEARVESIGAGTGSEFALLPAQNATGNWVKVVQRVPVRLRIEEPAQVPLRSGLSAEVSIDTGHARALPSPIRAVLGPIFPAGTAEAAASTLR
jgi:membrane fusion protein (multidrug efflux system)